jgi:hypothetical protein
MVEPNTGVVVKECLVVKELITGTYDPTPAAASTGYILVKSGDGVERKLMVQA